MESIETRPIDKALDICKAALKELSWLFVFIKKNDNSLSFPKCYLDFLSNFDKSHWSLFYESQEKLDSLAFYVIFEPEDLQAIAEEMKDLSPQELLEYRNDMESFFIGIMNEDDYNDTPWSFYVPNQREINEYLETTTLDQQQKDATRMYYILTFFITQISQFLALVTHGKTMNDLIKSAISGDDIAFCQAVQIDRTVLFGIPYFRKRLSRIQLGREKNLLHSLSRAMEGKIWSNRFPSPELWVVFAILQRLELLKAMSRDELLDFCVTLKVHKGHDPAKISSKRAEFLKRQAGVF